MELYEELDPDYLEKLAGLGTMALSNVFIQRAIYSSKKNLREITTEIIFQTPWYNKDNREVLSYKEYKEWENKND